MATKFILTLLPKWLTFLLFYWNKKNKYIKVRFLNKAILEKIIKYRKNLNIVNIKLLNCFNFA